MLGVRLLAGLVVLAAGIAWLTDAIEPIWWSILLLLSGIAVLVDAVVALSRRFRR